MSQLWLKLCVAILAGSALLGAASLSLMARRVLEAEGRAGQPGGDCGALVPLASYRIDR